MTQYSQRARGAVERLNANRVEPCPGRDSSYVPFNPAAGESQCWHCGLPHDKHVQEPTHVDLIATEPLVGRPRLIRRMTPDDPAISKQAREGTATYVAVSEPHTMADCPFTDGYFDDNTLPHGVIQTTQYLVGTSDARLATPEEDA